MNIYDFDGTIYNGDSTLDFLLFSIKKQPTLLRFLPGQVKALAFYALKRIEKTEMKEQIYYVFSGYDAQALLEEFWNCHENRIYPWYFEHHHESDIVVSASPEFLLGPICKRLGIQYLIASRVDIHSGKYYGQNCRGHEKVLRLNLELGIDHCDEFYSDSMSDQPMADIADRAYLIKNGKICNWNQ